MTGVFFMGISIAGYLKSEMNMVIRVVMFLGGVFMFVPNTLSSVIGILICAAAYGVSAAGRKRSVSM